MIVAVKTNKKKKLIKIVVLVILVAMFGAYYFHMSKTMKEQEQREQALKQAKLQEQKKEQEKKKKLEKTVLNEIEKIVDIVGQEYIRHIKIVDNNVIIICESDTNLEALKVRYGAMALVKKNLNETIVAINLNYVIESKLNGKKN